MEKIIISPLNKEYSDTSTFLYRNNYLFQPFPQVIYDSNTG